MHYAYGYDLLNCFIQKVILLFYKILNFFLCFSEDTSKRRSFGSRSFKDGEKPYLSPNQDRNASCKFPTLKLVLVIIILGALFTLLHSPAVYNTERPSHSGSRYVIYPTLSSIQYTVNIFLHHVHTG